MYAKYTANGLKLDFAFSAVTGLAGKISKEQTEPGAVAPATHEPGAAAPATHEPGAAAPATHEPGAAAPELPLRAL